MKPVTSLKYTSTQAISKSGKRLHLQFRFASSPRAGVRFGRPSTLQKYLPRVRALREAGYNISQIARELMLPYSSAHKTSADSSSRRLKNPALLGKVRLLFLFGTNHFLH